MVDTKVCGTRRDARTAALPLMASHIRDWPGFWAKVLAGDRRDEPNPGKRVWELLRDEAKQTVLSAARRGKIRGDETRSIVEALNALLCRADFYDERYFRGVVLDEEVESVLAHPPGHLHGQRSFWVNRVILRNCYPNEIVDPRAIRWTTIGAWPRRSHIDSYTASDAISRVFLWLGFAALALPVVTLVAELVVPQCWRLHDTRGLVTITWLGLLAACLVANSLLDNCLSMRHAADRMQSKLDELAREAPQ